MNADLELQNVQDKLTEAEKKAEEYLAGWKRARADYQNLEKSTVHEREAFVQFATEGIVRDLLPILDHATQAVAASPTLEGSAAEWVSGVRHVFDGLRHTLRAHGVEEIVVSRGDQFDPERHETVESRKEEGTEPGRVLVVVRSGHLLNKKLLRPAQVIISS